MTRGVLHVRPKSVVFEISVGPKEARSCWKPIGLAGGATSRSHTAYAMPGCTGSAVTDSLSLNRKDLALLHW
jgi:hypothetical protein